jgi:hypothetical protein
MRQLIWILMLAAAGGFGYWLWRARRRWLERQRAAEERLSRLMIEAQLAARRDKPASATARDTAGPG